MNHTHMSIGERVRLARKKAESFNEDFESRRTTIDYLSGISEECLKNYETGKTPPNDNVITIMSDAYNDPDLRSWYCSNACSIGKRKKMCEHPAKTIPDVLMKLYNSPDKSLDIINIIVNVFEDNELTIDEIPQVDKALELLIHGRNSYDNAITILEKKKAEVLYGKE